LSKVADFNTSHLHLALLYGATPVEFRGDLWFQKTRVPELNVTLHFAILVKHQLVTDRQTDRHRHRDITHTALTSRRAVKITKFG